jgi:hypothetical protein
VLCSEILGSGNFTTKFDCAAMSSVKVMEDKNKKIRKMSEVLNFTP